MKKIKVLFISHDDPGMGGAPKSLIELIKKLMLNYNIVPIVIVHSTDKVYEFCKNNGIECYVTHHRNTALGFKNKPTDWFKYPVKLIRQLYDEKRAYLYLNKKIDFKKIDLIHSNVSVTGLGIEICKHYAIPHIMHLRESPTIIDQYLFSHKRYIHYINHYVTKFIAISDYTKLGWEKAGLPSYKIDKIYNGLDLLPQKSHTILSDSKIRLVVVGTIQRQKGQFDIIKAVKLLPMKYKNNITVDIIGTGKEDYVNCLKSFTKKNKLYNIHFLGYKSNIKELLNKYDIGIMASPAEAFGRTTVEYMANGLGVIGAQGGATPELIENRVTGLLFEPNNPLSLEQAIEYIFLHRKSMCSYAKKAQEKAYTVFTSQNNSYHIYQEYIKILRNY